MTWHNLDICSCFELSIYLPRSSYWLTGFFSVNRDLSIRHLQIRKGTLQILSENHASLSYCTVLYDLGNWCAYSINLLVVKLLSADCDSTMLCTRPKFILEARKNLRANKKTSRPWYSFDTVLKKLKSLQGFFLSFKSSKEYLGQDNNGSQITSKCNKKKGRTWGHCPFCQWCSYHVLTSLLMYYWTDTRKRKMESINCLI